MNSINFNNHDPLFDVQNIMDCLIPNMLDYLSNKCNCHNDENNGVKVWCVLYIILGWR